ncbi:MAG: ABC transporter substrate-binding protein [Anaerolineae bacterium]|nr:ABC transporter substrate-binding protein [Anaerolineae bacterium]
MKRSLLLILVVLLIAVPLAGCGPGTSVPETEPETGSSQPPAAEEPVELIWIMGNPGQVPPDQAMVEEKLNEISVAALNVKVTTLYYDNERTMLAMSAGDEWDMVFTCEWFNNFPTQARAGYFADLTNLLPSVAPGLYTSMPEIVWEGAKVDGQILAIPVKKDYAAELFWVMDKELFESTLGMTIPDEMSFFDIEKYLAAAKKAWEEGVSGTEEAEYPMYISRGGVGGLTSEFDNIHRGAMLGIPYSAKGDDADKILVILEHPDLYDRLVAVHKWYEAGYINPDAPTLDTAPYSPVWAGQGFYGADAIWTQSTGVVVKISKFSGPNLSTASIRGAMNAINADSPNVELALKYQELVNTNKEYRDILRYGIEGVHFNYQEDGTVMRTEQGRTNYVPWPFSQGSYSLSSVEAAEGVEVDPQMWEVIFDGYKDLQATNAVGFAFDITPVEGEIAALQVIVDKYWTGLITGVSDPAVEVPKMIAEMEAAGLRDVQAEAQSQFDVFLAESRDN